MDQRQHERRAYLCVHKEHEGCAYRVFLQPGEPVPSCHGRPMMRQANLRYRRPDVTAPLGPSQTAMNGRRK